MSDTVPQWVRHMDAGSWKGDSAYETAVRHGFEGTEEEWLESLHGQPGQDANDVTVNGRAAVGGNITLRGTDIPLQEGLTQTLAQAVSGKADSVHGHAAQEISGLTEAMNTGILEKAIPREGGTAGGDLWFAHAKGIRFSLGNENELPSVTLCATDSTAGKPIRFVYTDADGNRTPMNLIGADGTRKYALLTDLPSVSEGTGSPGSYLDTSKDYTVVYYRYGPMVVCRINGTLASGASGTGSAYQIATGLPACNAGSKLTLYGPAFVNGVHDCYAAVTANGTDAKFYNNGTSAAGKAFKALLVYMTKD